MLRSFRVSNHRSIRAEVELSLLPAYDKTRTALPVAASVSTTGVRAIVPPLHPSES